MPTLPDLPKVEAAIIEMTNTARSEQLLGAVTVSPQLTAAARAYAAVLARTKIFSHEADGTTMSARIDKSGYKACTAAENLALHQSSRGFETRELAISAMEGWLNSPGHRKNIMTSEVTETGVAVVKGPEKDPKFLIVQLLGRPESLAVEFQVSNTAAIPVTMAFGGKSSTVEPKMAIKMTSCSAGPLVLSAAGARAFQARYEAVASKTFLIAEPDGRGPLTVEVRERVKVK
jgi:hypothetical protein